MRQLLAHSRQSSVIRIRKDTVTRRNGDSEIFSASPRLRVFLFTALCLFTFHYSLFTASADEITSKAAFVMEASTGRVLYGKNPNLKLSPASTTKLMTAMVVLDRANMNDVVTISNRAAGVSPIKANFKAGEAVTIATLLYAALLRSANDAAVALAEAVAGSERKFVELMNKKAVAIGVSDTRFINSTGLPGRGQYITAYDLAKIMRHALKYPVIREVIGTRATEISTEKGRTIFLKNTNRLLWSDDELLGGKTGYTKKAGHCFVCAGERDRETVIVALLGTPNRENLWRESESLIDKGFEVIASNKQPVVYFTKADYRASVKKAAYKKSSKVEVRSSKLKTYSKNNKTKFAKAPSMKKSTGMQTKKNAKSFAKESKRSKDTEIARSSAGGNKG